MLSDRLFMQLFQIQRFAKYYQYFGPCNKYSHYTNSDGPFDGQSGLQIHSVHHVYFIEAETVHIKGYLPCPSYIRLPPEVAHTSLCHCRSDYLTSLPLHLWTFLELK